MKIYKKIACLVLAFCMMFSFTGCKEEEENDIVPTEPGDLGTPTTESGRTLSHSKELGRDYDGLYQLYHDIGSFSSTEELDKAYLEYVSNIKTRIAAEGLFSEIYDDTSSENYRALQAFDPTMRYSYNLYCNQDGYQSVQMSITLYKIEQDDWNNYDFSTVTSLLGLYTGIDFLMEDLQASMNEVRERVKEGGGFSVHIGSDSNEYAANVSVMEYDTEFEVWTFDVMNLVSPGENFYLEPVDENVMPEETPVDSNQNDYASEDVQNAENSLPVEDVPVETVPEDSDTGLES